MFDELKQLKEIEIFDIPPIFGRNTSIEDERVGKRYCIYHDIHLDKCDNVECPMHDCKFAKFHLQISTMLKTEYPGLSGRDAKKMARRLLINTFQPKSNENNRKYKF